MMPTDLQMGPKSMQKRMEGTLHQKRKPAPATRPNMMWHRLTQLFFSLFISLFVLHHDVRGDSGFPVGQLLKINKTNTIKSLKFIEPFLHCGHYHCAQCNEHCGLFLFLSSFSSCKIKVSKKIV